MKPIYLPLFLGVFLSPFMARGEEGPITLSPGQLAAMNSYYDCMNIEGNASERAMSELLCNSGEGVVRIRGNNVVDAGPVMELPVTPPRNASEAQISTWADEMARRMTDTYYPATFRSPDRDEREEDLRRSAFRSAARRSFRRAFNDYVDPTVNTIQNTRPGLARAGAGVFEVGRFALDGARVTVFSRRYPDGRDAMKIQFRYDGVIDDDQRVMLSIRFRN